MTLTHALLAAGASLALVRALHQPWMRDAIRDERALFAFVVWLPLASGLASLLAIILGRRTRTPLRALVTDLAGALAALAVVVPLALGPTTKEVAGLYYLAVLAARLAPLVLLVLDGRERSAAVVFALSALAYSGVALWSSATTFAQGDQPHYLLVAERLLAGNGDVTPAYATPQPFRALAGIDLSEEDLATHVIRTRDGARPVQGYGLAALVAPGWALAGRDGALLVIALIAAFASAQTYLLCRETLGDSRVASAAWALAALAAPTPTLAAVVFPNVAGAAAIVFAYRLLFTAERRRPLVAGAAAATTLLLTPRDAVAVAFLLPFAVLAGRAVAARFVGALLVAAVLVSGLNLALYGLAVPYAGYVYGIAAAQSFLGQPTLSFEVWRALPGMLFDRAFGIAGSAPWVFLGVAGALPAFRSQGLRLAPALAAVAGSILALSVYRLWQGGWSPPNRYLVDVLPLWAPFVGFGMLALARAATAALLALSAIASFFLLAVPNLAYNGIGETRLAAALDQVLVVDPFGWLPSFEAPDLGALALAWMGAIPFIVGVVALFALGARPVRFPRAPTLPLFLALNALGVAAVALLARADGPGASAQLPLATALVTRWLPYAMALATALTAVLAWRSPHPRSLYARHAALWFAVPATLALVRFGDALDQHVLGAPYVALVLGVALHGVAELWATRDRRDDRAIGALLGLTVLATALVLLPYDRTVRQTESDEPHYLVAMRSLVRDGDLDVRNQYDRADYADFYPRPMRDRHVVDVGTRQYPIHDLGLVFAGAIPFALGGRTGVLALLCVAGAVLAWRGYALVRRLEVSREASLLATAAVALAHPLLTYTTQVYPELLGAVVVLVVAELLWTRSPARLVAAGALVGTLPWLSARFWPIAVALLLVALWSARARAVAALVPFALVVGAYVALDAALFGIALPNAGYYAIRNQQTLVAAQPHLGLTGVLLDRTFGLLSRVPLYFLAAYGLVPLLRRRATPVAALGLSWLLSFLLVGTLSYWHADGSPSSRYLVATLPFLLCAVAAGLDRLRGPAAVRAATVAALWSFAVTGLLALAPDLRYDLAAEVALAGGPGALWAFVGHAYRATPGLLFPSLVRAAPEDLVLAVAWIAVLVALVAIGWRSSRRPLPGIVAS